MQGIRHELRGWAPAGSRGGGQRDFNTWPTSFQNREPEQVQEAPGQPGWTTGLCWLSL